MARLRNPKQEAFAQSIAAGSNLTDAARASGYKESRAYSTGSELRKRPDVSARIDELKAKREHLAEQHSIYGMRECLAETEQALQLAMSNGQPGHMVAAITLKAKLVGLLVERRQIDYKNVGELSDAELESLIASAEASRQGKAAIDKASEPREPVTVSDVMTDLHVNSQ